MNLLFVCTGNTCRSPMAEAIFRSKNIPGVNVKSAGVYADNYSMASLNTVQVLAEKGIAIHHQSQSLSEELMNWASLVLTMTAGHKQLVLNNFPAASHKVFTLTEYAGEKQIGDVIDPFGGSLEIYKETYHELTDLIDKLKVKLERDMS
ncbi:low molecular weight protein arginine phosphatase [Bacillus sp. PS06]|uniref:low molecular weight protein arginine phosphatase n=1 Tax=Bacillus sp. PS06 TaxID=2764176 RepID=UPI00177C5C19|nr:low molecular weight protein arginine phosphatase [Bacillus sp. PS06]MBD8069516.1 low molecular weight protein arginine phosphatase [Bacillus sp. PS06]